MNNNKRNINESLYDGLKGLRGYLSLEVAQKVLVEYIFVTLLINEIKRKNEYFVEKIKGLDLNKDILNEQKFSKTIHQLRYKNEILYEPLADLDESINKEYDLIEKLTPISNDIENYSEIRSGDLFLETIELLVRNSKSSDLSTTSNITSLVSALLNDKDIKSIYDPTIGTGRLVLNVASNHKDALIYGEDINMNVLKICKMCLILNEKIEDIPNIEYGNTIVNPGNIEDGKLKRFDCIVSNPPFGVRDWGYDEIIKGDLYNRFHRGIPSKALGDYAFITHVIESLNEKGIAVMVEPSGVLFREGAEGIIREKLIEENIIDCIISLPSNMMYGTALPINLLIFNKVKSSEDILFIDVTKKVKSSKVLTTLSDEEIEEISEVYNKRVEVKNFSRKVYIDEIIDNKYNLSVQRYIEEEYEREILNMKDINNNILELEEKLKNIKLEIDKYFK